MHASYQRFVFTRTSLILVGTAGALMGIVAAYVYSNPKLRRELQHTDHLREAADVFGRHVQADGEVFAADVRDFIRHPRFRARMNKAAHFLFGKAHEATDTMGDVATAATTKVRKQLKRASEKIEDIRV